MRQPRRTDGRVSVAAMSLVSTLGKALSACVLAGTFVYMAVLQDPMLMYMMIATAVMAVFPTYREIVALISLYCAWRIATQHDPVTGDYTSFVATVADGVDVMVGGLATVAMSLALWPVLPASLTFKWSAIASAAGPAIPLVSLVVTRYFVEAQAGGDLTRLGIAVADHVRELYKNLQALLSTLRGG